MIVEFPGRHVDNLATWQWDSTTIYLSPESLAAPLTAVEEKHM